MAVELNDTVRRIIGSQIKLCRKNKNVSQAKLAKSIGVGFMTVSRWENGKTDISGIHLRAIAKALNVSADFLLGINGDETAKWKLAKIRKILEQ